MNDPEYTYWTNQKWDVATSAKSDPLQYDVLLFTAGMTIERWQITQGATLAKVEDWATGCIWDSNTQNLRGITPDGSQTFVVARNGATLTCTFTDLVAQRQRRLGVLLGSLLGGFAGLLTGFAVGVQPVEAIAVGLSASLLSALVTAGTTSYNHRTGDTWVANEGGSGLPQPPDTSTEETSRRLQTPTLRTAKA